MEGAPAPGIPASRMEGEEHRIFVDLLGREQGDDPYAIKKELWATMDSNVYVYRNEQGLTEALKKVRELRARYSKVRVEDKSKNFNTNLTGTLEVGNLLDVAEAVVTSALLRKESRGGHARKDFPKRDDVNFLKHSMVYYTPEGPRVEYLPVVITKWAPMERKY
jgi:succinate dehydrogenase / fumarate reductase flavoprotein subunit